MIICEDRCVKGPRGGSHVHRDRFHFPATYRRRVRPAARPRLSPKKAAEYLDAGVLAVVVLDAETQTAVIYYPEQMPRILGADDELSLPEILPGFAIAVRRFFD